MQDMEEVVKHLMEKYGQHTVSSMPKAYRCEKCQDTGWLDMGNNTVAKCSCRLAREAEERMRRSGLAEALDTQTLESFQIRTEVQRKIKETAERYLSDLLGNPQNPRRPWLYIGKKRPTHRKSLSWCHRETSFISKWLYIFVLKNRYKRNLPLLLHPNSALFCSVSQSRVPTLMQSYCFISKYKQMP